MRITTWNCNGGFHRKLAAANSLGSDLLVVPECASLAPSHMELGDRCYNNFEWIGRIPSKGLGVLSFGDFSIRPWENYNPAHRLILPLEVSGPTDFVLLAVWTLPHENGSYVRPLVEALEEYGPALAGRNVVMAGDFNANMALPGKPGYHFRVFLDLAERVGLRSLYHGSTGEPHGSEATPTFFLHRNRAKPLHLDFIFANDAMRLRMESLDVGSPDDWLARSDHMPLTAAFC